jgi:uncharacterized protein (UPF0212 family)
MIIWGSKNRFKKIDEGQFHCPKCGVNRDYHLKHAQRYFTLYFIPLVPIKNHGEFVECQTCVTTFDTAVLNMRIGRATTAQLGDQLAAMMNALKPRLEEGYPIEFMVRDLTATRLDRSVALQAVDNAIGSRRKTCPACGLTYAPTVASCHDCGSQLS